MTNGDGMYYDDARKRGHKVVPLAYHRLVMIDDEHQRTNNINGDPPITEFQRDIWQSMIFARLSHGHTFKDNVHDFVKITGGTAHIFLFVCILIHGTS